MRAFVALGAVIGILAGMTAQSVVAAVIPLFLSFAGGSAIAFFSKEADAIRKHAERAILGLSLGTFVGLLAGIAIAENQLLTLPANRDPRRNAVADRKYLRSAEISAVAAIDEQVRNKRLSKDEAYDKILALTKP